MLDLNAMVHEIIERSFPELRGIDVSCQLTEAAEDFFAGIQWKQTEPPQIIITFSSEDAKKMPDAALVGCIAHELCHAEYDYPLSPSIFAANDQQYAADPAFRSKHEREIDLAAINKGYGRELLALQLYHNENYDPYQPSDGLTPEETEAILREMADR